MGMVKSLIGSNTKNKASPKRGKYALKGTHYVKQLNYSAFLRINQSNTHQEAI